MPATNTATDGSASSHPGLYVFEGADGSGKSTLCSGIAEALRAMGREVDLYSFPGRAPRTLGELVYRLHHGSESCGVGYITHLAVQAMHIAAHLDTIESRIAPALERRTSVILDKFWWSTWVYGMLNSVPETVLSLLAEAERETWNRHLPDCVFLVRTPEPRGRRISGLNWARLRELYETIAGRERGGQRVAVIDNSRSEQDAIAEVLLHIGDATVTDSFEP